jgi:hypothetical protein
MWPIERFKKYCSHSERGFLGFSEALAKEQLNIRTVKLTRSTWLVQILSPTGLVCDTL